MNLETILVSTDVDVLKQVASDHFGFDEADYAKAVLEAGYKDYSITDFCRDYLRENVIGDEDVRKLVQLIENENKP